MPLKEPAGADPGKNVRRARFTVRGQVQGVGFRPFVFLLAEKCALSGFVRNGPDGVLIEVQGEEDNLHAFACGLTRDLPPLARITDLDRENLPPKPEEKNFDIAASGGGRGQSVLVSPDVGICPACLAEIRDRTNRRFRHPFANCTDCGPRYSLTRSIPYDRSGTSMACFPMCPKCRAEYENPRDRRFHAQPNACPHCGPVLRLELPGGTGELIRIEGDRALPALARFLFDGGIAAVKGIGGFHLACDAGNDRAVAELRRRKGRPHQALAVMAADLAEVRRFVSAGPAEEDALLSPEHPIVICPLRPSIPEKVSSREGNFDEAPDPDGSASPLSSLVAPAGSVSRLSSSVSPDTRTIGVMLPYSPLHVLLLDEFTALVRQEGRTAALVMTSGNRSGEPICLGNREARSVLAGIADAFLFHNRDILVRVDDSVVRPRALRGCLFAPQGTGLWNSVVRPRALRDGSRPAQVVVGKDSVVRPRASRDGQKAGLLFFRRARGFVPRPISFAASVGKSEEGRQGGTLPCVLGAGAELKNAPCLTRGTDAFVCQHTGDMEDAGTAAFHEEAIDHTARLLHVAPEIIVRDMHPDSLSGRIAEDYAGRSGLPVLRLQHHFAHAHALLAENGHAGKALALVLDGSGFGSDGTLWGGELLFLDPHPAGGGLPEHRRLARLAPLDLPGGDAAVREPWRIAHALLLRLGLIDGRGAASFSLPWLPDRKFAADMLPAMLPAVPSAILMPSGGIMTDGGLNTPRGSGCGRLFDAVSALLGLCLEASYEGQGAIRLEEAQGVPPPASDLSFPDPSFPDPSLPDPVLYPCPLLPDPEQGEAGLLLLDTRALFRALCEDLARAVPVALLARRFHRSLAAGLVEAAAFLAAEHGLQTAGLSGGCMLNMTLSELLREGLEKKGMTVLEHGALPPGDGCIGFGQAVYGALVSVVMKRGCETE